MGDSVLTPTAGIPLALALIAIFTTARRVRSAYTDRRIVCQLIESGGIDPAREDVNNRNTAGTIRREWFRVIKCFVLVGAIGLSYTPWASDSGLRNWADGLIAVGLFLNSVLDERLQGWTIRDFARSKKESR